jgi:PTS system mannose-specific IID component
VKRAGLLRLLNCALSSLFLESSFNDEGKQNLGYAAAMFPALKRLRPAMTQEELLGLLKPFSTNPFMSGLVLGAALKMAEEESGEARDGPLPDELVACLASAAGAKGDQIFWNTWLRFSALAAFFVTWFFQSPWGPLLLPLLFTLAALPFRFLGFYWGYRKGAAASTGVFNALVLGLRRRLQTAVLFCQGLLTALVLDSVPLNGGPGPPELLFFASAFFLALLLGSALLRLSRSLLVPLYLLETAALFLILSAL